MAASPDLAAAAKAVELGKSVVAGAVARFRDAGPDALDRDQVVAYDLAHAAAAVENARAVLDYGAKGEVEARIACAFVADAIFDLVTKVMTREATWGADHGALREASDFVSTFRDPAFLADLCGEQGPRHLDSDFEMVQDTFRRFAEEKVIPVAEHIHRTNSDIPE